MINHKNELDLEGLDEIFSDGEESNMMKEQKKVEFETDIDYDDALDALKKNIHNANKLLEKIQEEMNNGNFSARLAEVAGNVLNSVTQASKEIISDKNYEKYMEVRRQLAELKKKEVDIKQAKLVRPASQTNNILVTNREDLLKMLEDKKLKKIN
jgi:hypothetical protein